MMDIGLIVSFPWGDLAGVAMWDPDSDCCRR
jgi:hypothetical protein